MNYFFKIFSYKFFEVILYEILRILCFFFKTDSFYYRKYFRKENLFQWVYYGLYWYINFWQNTWHGPYIQLTNVVMLWLFNLFINFLATLRFFSAYYVIFVTEWLKTQSIACERRGWRCETSHFHGRDFLFSEHVQALTTFFVLCVFCLHLSGTNYIISILYIK